MFGQIVEILPLPRWNTGREASEINGRRVNSARVRPYFPQPRFAVGQFSGPSYLSVTVCERLCVNVNTTDATTGATTLSCCKAAVRHDTVVSQRRCRHATAASSDFFCVPFGGRANGPTGASRLGSGYISYRFWVHFLSDTYPYVS